MFTNAVRSQTFRNGLSFRHRRVGGYRPTHVRISIRHSDLRADRQRRSRSDRYPRTFLSNQPPSPRLGDPLKKPACRRRTMRFYPSPPGRSPSLRRRAVTDESLPPCPVLSERVFESRATSTRSGPERRRPQPCKHRCPRRRETLPSMISTDTSFRLDRVQFDFASPSPSSCTTRGSPHEVRVSVSDDATSTVLAAPTTADRETSSGVVQGIPYTFRYAGEACARGSACTVLPEFHGSPHTLRRNARVFVFSRLLKWNRSTTT